jgi:VWFA-related protein
VIRRSLTALCGLLATAAVLSGQDRPTFRAAIEAVQVDVLVTDREGRLVSGLTAADFELLENGKPQAITTFSAVDIPIERGERPLAEPDVRTNSGPEGRIYLIALDEVGTHPDRPDTPLKAKAFLRRFIEEYFGPNDVAAVVLTGRGLATDGQDFTNNRRLLLTAIDKFSGGFRQEEAPESQNAADTAQREKDFRMRSRMASLRALAEFMAMMPGRRKAMLFVSEGIGFNMFEVVDYAGGVLSLAGEDARAAMRAATRSSLAIYPIDPLGLGLEGTLEDRADLAALAHVTGGFSLSNSENFAGAFERMVREQSTYYLLGFNSGYEKRDGRYVKLEVRVKRPGLRVQTRDGYVAPVGKASAAAAAITPRPSFSDAIASAIATPGVPMRVFAAAYKGAGRNAAVVLAVEVDAAQLELVEANGVFTGRMDVGFVATDAKKKITRSPRYTTTFAMKPETHQRFEKNGMRLILQADLPEGRYQLRVAAGGAARAGSVVYDLEVPDFTKTPLILSGVSLTSSAAAAAVTRQLGGDLLGDVLPHPPTASRTFAPDETLVLYAEVYENLRTTAPHPIFMTTELRGDDGRIVRMVSEQRASSDPQRKSGGYAFAPRLSLEDVPPGQYLLHVETRSGAGGRAVTREIPLRVQSRIGN